MLDQIAHLVAQMPDHWATAPIYKKGIALPSGAPAVGKSPLGKAHHQDLTPSESFLYLQEEPDTYGAIGVFSGARSGGLVILDVDANLGALEMKWGADLAKAPRINSPKQNAAKFLFRIAEEHWGSVSDVSLAASKQGFEVLWGRQGLVCGDYHAGGSYEVVGDISAVPEAPAWLLAVMRKSFSEKAAKAEGNRLVDSRYSMRTCEERVAIARSCLSMIPAPGRGSEDLWWRLGAMVASELPGDEGLEVWREWSKKDPEYAEDWDNGNDPCAVRWAAGFSKKGLGFGSLIKLADHHDPTRSRFQRDNLASLVDEVEASTVKVVTPTLSFEEIIERGMKIYEGEDVARMNYELHALAMEARYKDQSGIEKLLLDHITQQGNNAGRSMDERVKKTREFLIPGLLPRNYSVLFFGDAGCGKSATAISLMKHVVDGIPFQLKDQLVPVERGPVVYFNADMSDTDFEEEFDLHEIKNEADFYFEPDFNLYKRVQFVKTMNRIKPKMICIDSLSSCSGAKAGDENKAEFAQPLYWLNVNNGVLWPECAIIVLHHAAKAGGARGSSAIAAAVAEVWNISKPKQDSGLAIDQRVIQIGKSRINRSGETLIQTQNDDLTVSLVEAKKPKEVQTRAGTVAERIMNRLQTSKQPLSRHDLNADPLVGGSVAAIQKTLQRLENRGVVEVTERSSQKGGKPEKFYSALRAWGESVRRRTSDETPCNDRDEQLDTLAGTETCPVAPTEGSHEEVDNSSKKPECPVAEPSAGAGSDPEGTQDLCPRARDDRSPEEMRALNNAAWNEFDLDL